MDYTTLKESEFAQNFKGSDILCDHFKDKTRYIELPCAVGDFIYLTDSKKVWDAKVEKITLYKKPIIIQGSYWNDKTCEWDSFLSPTTMFGKTVFLTKEDAEQVLKGGAE